MRLQVCNFQSLKDVELLVEGITLIIGSNNEGKTATIRALHSSLAGRSGDDFIRFGESTARVATSFDADEDNEALEVTWQKKRGKGAHYTLNGVEYTKLGRKGVPVEDLKKYGIQSVPFSGGQECLMFWFQREAPFLVGLPPTQVFDFVSRILEERKIIPVLKKMNADRLELERSMISTEGSIQTLGEGIESLQGQVEEMSYLDGAETLVAEVEALSRRESTLESLLQSFYALLERYDTARSLMGQEQARVDVFGGLDQLVESQGVLENQKQAIDSLQYSLSSIGVLQRSQQSTRILLEGLVPIQVASEGERSLEEMSNFLLMFSQAQDREEKALSGHRAARDALFIAEESLEVTQSTLGSCPLCGSDLEGLEL